MANILTTRQIQGNLPVKLTHNWPEKLQTSVTIALNMIQQ